MAAAEGRIAAPRDLRDVVDAVLKVTRPERVLLFGSGARGEMSDRSDIDILVIDEAPGGNPRVEAGDRQRAADGVALDGRAGPDAGRASQACERLGG